MAYYLTFHFETISEIGIKRSDLLIFCIAFILELFQVHSKTEWKVQRFPLYPLPPHMHASCIVNVTHNSSAFVKIDEPTLTHHIHPKSIINVGFTIGAVHSVCLDKCIMIIIIIIQNIFTALKNPVFHLLLLPTYPTNPLQPPIFLLSPYICLFQNAIELES